MAEPHRFSIKRRLLLLLLGATALVWLGAAGYGYFEARHEMGEVLDAHLAQSAALLLAQAGRDVDEIDTEHAPQLHKYGRKVAFQMWERGTLLRLHSANAPDRRLSAQEEGFSSARIDDRQWRVFSAWDERRRYLVQVGERSDARDEVAGALAEHMLAPAVGAMALLALLIWVAVSHSLRPLALLSAQVRERGPHSLAPLDAGDAPEEVLPLAENLNRLFERVRQSMESERRFTADAAHEMRTPIAAVKIQAQVARAAALDAERRRALDNVIAGCDRASHVVEQLLTLARLEPEDFRAQLVRCDLLALAASVISDMAAQALERNVDLELDATVPVIVDGDPALLGILLRNLVDNAVRYSPPGSAVRVDARTECGSGVLSVTDNGRGIPAEDRDMVLQRFYRILGSGESGSGLGLSIVQRIAEIHGAEVRLAQAPGGRGLRVDVSLGLSGT